MSKKLNANYYTDERVVFKDGKHQLEKNNDFLYSNGKYKTKLTKEDMPNYYIESLYYAYNHGFMNASGVKYIVYKSNKFSNHMFKDDFLYISYNKPITENKDKNSFDFYEGYDEYVWGSNIISMLKAIEKYSNYDISEIKKQIEEKRIWFKENYPTDYEHEVGNCDFWKD